jgi:hypothetical protein
MGFQMKTASEEKHDNPDSTEKPGVDGASGDKQVHKLHIFVLEFVKVYFFSRRIHSYDDSLT